MAKKKCKCPPPGAPDWMITYGDMMTLLLCFFVLIVSFSQIKKEDEFQAVVEEIKKSFGMKGGGGKLPTDDDPEMSMMQMLETVGQQQQQQRARSSADDPGVDGKEAEVTTIREGERYVVGGLIRFEPGSAELTARAREQLQKVASLIRGKNNLIEVKGHTARMEPIAGGVEPPRPGVNPITVGSNQPRRAEDLWQLSYMRARTVFDYLTNEPIGLDPQRFRLIGNADREPLRRRAYGSQAAGDNRRVEVELTDKVIKDFTQPQR